ncbi:aminotransferase class V-fold PLP-dependent enzyme [Alteromonas sp. NFXS44]|uniref:aminotransferase class V-fold PLP-dependent enzyme n=1 Tax=Alteromonas sp. NFXS44 TaxID=2818435 RepID=UPI0032DE58F5
MPHITRRHFVTGALASTAMISASEAFADDKGLPFPEHFTRQPGHSDIASDETFWSQVASYYDVKPGIINVENGNWGIMSRPVMQAYFAHTQRVNRDNSYFSRKEYWPVMKPVWHDVANRLNVLPEEVCLTRGATEALQNLIGNYQLLKAGDGVMFADLDYDAMQAAMRHKAGTTGADIIELSIPEPADKASLLQFYRTELEKHPHCKLLLLTHISHRTGLVIPVAEITDIAKARGVDVIVDAAHSWGQLNFTADELKADFIGFNMHKWMGAPIGAGAMFIRHARLQDIGLNMSSEPEQQDSIRGRVHSGTSNFAAFLTLPDAFRFHDLIGADAKAARLKYLRKIWVDAVSDIEEINVLTPNEDESHAGITSFRLAGKVSTQENKAIADYLFKKHGIFTVHREGIAAGSCVRITPGYYNSSQDMQTVSAALKDTVVAFRG